MADNKYHFEKLTPTDSIELGVYEDAINYVFDNDDVKNVAISGAYSAGKSSVLASYKKKHNDLSFLHISLAHFKSPNQENKSKLKSSNQEDESKSNQEDESKSNQEDESKLNQEDEIKVSESVLEGKILNQLIHQIPAEKIPQTNFRVKKQVNLKNIVLITAEIVLLLISVSYFACFDIFGAFIKSLPANWFKSIISPFTHQYALVVDGLLILGLISIIIYGLIKVQKNRNVFRKLNFQGNEIEIFEESDDSYFDKYLNEVLYLFENAATDVIVFEDMDRFNLNRIFERLHEVNTLANIQLKKDNKKVLRFFYLLRDDIFISKDRTKFFDYIIPVVPVVDSSNSYDQFISHFKKSGLFEKFDESFLQGLSLYIDDMRLLKNIYNEFLIYYSRLNTIELNCNKMLALIAYKNLFPRDFADLQLNQGFVFAIFNNRDAFMAEETERLNQLVAEKDHEIKLAKNEHLETIKELNAAFEDKRAIDRWNCKQELSADQKKEYANRKKAIENRINIKIPELEKEKSLLEQELILTQNKQLCEIITRENIGTIFSITSKNEIGQVTSFNEIKSCEYFELLKYLIRNGCIDETYADYMTYFYENSLSRIDKTFLRSITDKKPKEYTYQLKNPQLVVSRLRLVDFDQEETLNFELFEYLLLNQTDSKYVSYLQALIEQLRKTKNFDFISKFYETGKSRKKFVTTTNEQWPEFFSVILTDNALPTAQIREYSVDTLCYSDNDTIITVNADNCLTEYISNNPDYLAVEINDINKLVSSFQLINIVFSSIDYAKSHNVLFDEVYRHNLYSLTFENIALMLKHEYGIEDTIAIIHRNYTLVRSQSDAPLAIYIYENIGEYIEVVLDKCEGSISDDEDAAISILNFADIELDAKKQYVKYLSTIITDITQVAEEDLWTIIMEQKVINYSVENLVNYFNKYGLDSALVVYINNMPAGVAFSSVADEFGEKTAGKLFDATVICNDITNEKYEKILNDLGFLFDNFEANEISDEKFKFLISNEIIQMNIECLNFVREKYAAHCFEFIRRNLNEYLSLQSDSILNIYEALEILAWPIKDDQKVGLLAFTDTPISVVGKQYSDPVNAYIILNNLNEEDLEHLYACYSQYGEETQKAIGTLAVDRVSVIISDSMEMDEDLLSVLIQSDTVPRSQKISLFTIAIPKLNEDTCKIHLDELGLTELKGIFIKTGGRRNYEKNDDVAAVLEGLKTNGWIYEYHEDERNDAKYVITKNKPRNKAPEFLD